VDNAFRLKSICLIAPDSKSDYSFYGRSNSAAYATPGIRQEHCALEQDRSITPVMALSIRTVIPGISIAGVRLIFAGRAWVVFSIVSGLCFLTVMFIAPKEYLSASRINVLIFMRIRQI